jgi:ATP-binding cassette, subfamily C, bacterial CydC
MKTLIRYIQRGKAYYPQMLLSVLLNVLTVGSSIALMSTSAYLITMAGFHPSIAELQVAIVGVRFFGISRGVFRYLDRLVSHAVNFKILTGLRVWFFDKFEQAYPIEGVQLEQGDLVNRALDDIDTLENLYVRIIAPAAAALILAIVTSLVIGSFYGPSGWILFGGLTISGLLVPVLTYTIVNRSGTEIQSLKGKYRAQVTRVVQAAEEILVFQQQKETLQILADTAAKIKQKEDRLDTMSEGINLLNFLILQATFIFTLIAVIQGARLAGLNPVLISVSGMMVLASFEATQSLGQAAVQLGKVNQAIRRLEQITQAESRQSIEYTESVADVDSIEFKNVGFSYADGDGYAVEDINFEINTGKHIAIVGPSGSGKSTLLKLLQGFYDPKSGSIQVNNQTLPFWNLDNYRKQFTVVGQEPFLFHQSLRKNLDLANPDATDEELVAALEFAELGDWFTNLPNGLETQLQESAANISAGERQRLSIARAWLKQAAILIMDEPTANLDAETEDSIMRKLLHDNDRTLVWVTHRMKYLDAFDELLFIQGGKILERGTFTTLLEKQGAFAHYWQLQNEYLI